MTAPAVIYRVEGWTVTLTSVEFGTAEAIEVHCPCGYQVDDGMAGCPFCWGRMPVRIKDYVDERRAS